MREFIIKYWIEFVFGAVAAGLGAAFKVLSKRVQKQLCDQQSLREGTQALLRSEIIKEYDKYMGVSGSRFTQWKT